MSEKQHLMDDIFNGLYMGIDVGDTLWVLTANNYRTH